MSDHLGWITNFIWGIADDVLRDLYVRGKYRDVVLPMTVPRRIDAVLEPTKKAVLDMKKSLDAAGIANQDQALRQASGQAFYNTSVFTLRDLRGRASQQVLKADFESYLDGYSPNVQEILDEFEFRNQIPRLSKADALGTLVEKFLDASINPGPKPVLAGDGSVRLAGLDNHAMGTIFEELVRRFNEENNEEAGEHWTPRDAVKLMARLIFPPIADQVESGTYLLYDGACGTGGMLTVAEETLQRLAREHGKEVATHLYGQEINAETYAIAKADLLLKGEGDAADNLVGGPEHSTLSADAFPSREFDFMLSNPPYGKSWKSDQEHMGGRDGMNDRRFVIQHAGVNGLPLATLELKNRITKQTVQDAAEQYRKDRDPRELVFGFGRCMAHFAVDDQEVWFCTHLKGAGSWFLPFNRGSNDGAGNPPNPEGLKTDYLWRQILAPRSLADIVENYAQIVETRDARTDSKHTG